jgi:hypothetical protein
MNMQQYVTGVIALLLIPILGVNVDARQPEKLDGRALSESPENNNRTVNFREDCAQATDQVDMTINNVRARLLAGGDVWWNLSVGRYIVPKVEPGSGQREISSIFAGSVWIGGFDDQGNLRMAANTYRSASSNDWYPGPLDPGGETTVPQCENWDRFFRVTGEEIREHQRNMLEFGENYNPADIPDGVKYWPGQGNQFFFDRYRFELPDYPQGLGSFKDFGPGMDEDNPNGIYNPLDGDYPVIQIRECPLDNFPDEMFFWIYNDAAGPHTSTQAIPIRMEVQVQAFAYATNDEINNMTFYRYKMINRAEQSLDSAFFAMWVDGDLGCDGDDYIGCDTSLSLMLLYNEDEIDGDVGSTCNCASNAPTYCNEVPILGVDYFRGPLGPKVFGSDGSLRNPNLGELPDTIVELGMSSFTYYNRQGGPGGWPAAMTDPQNGVEFYNYISGSWRDGTHFTFGGSGYNPNDDGARQINYAFTGAPDDANGWSMCTAGLALGDRRTVQASGPFRLDPGSVNELIIGAVWSPDVQTYPCPDLTPLIRADVKAQALFDACFVLPDGPNAPDLGIVELDREVIFTFSNDTARSNNAFLGYEERGLDIPGGDGVDTNYRFEGYIMYQLAGPDVDPGADGTLEDPNLARQVFQCDLRNDVSTIYRWEPQSDPFNPSLTVYSPVEVVAGNNEGVANSLVVREDAFATGSGRLVNNKRYFYYVIAYAYNNYDTFDYRTGIGQAEPFFVGRRNLRVYEVIPRPTPYTDLNSSYGEGAEVIRLDGQGAGNQFLRLSRANREAMLNEDFDGEIRYAERGGPIDVKIFNPYEATDGEYLVEFFDDNMDDDIFDASTGKFRVTQVETGEEFESLVTLDKISEQLIPDWGISIFAKNLEEPGETAFSGSRNGAIGSDVRYADSLKSPSDGWLLFTDENDFFNWLQTGSSTEPDFELDPGEGFSQVIQGPLYPYSLISSQPEEGTNPYISPAWYDDSNGAVRSNNPISNLNNVDIVLTADRDKWSKCIVVESSNREYRSAGFGSVTGENNVQNLSVRTLPSRGKEVNPTTGDPVILSDEPTGFSYFPGYAVNVETGERLNIFFGENSSYSDEILGARNFPDSLRIGNDMIWNPTSDVLVNTPAEQFPLPFFLGGQHFIYVTNQPYDGCAELREGLAQTAGMSSFIHRINKSGALPAVQWAGLPLLNEGFELTSFAEGLIPEEVVISMRVDNPYGVASNGEEGVNNGYPAYKFTIEGAEEQEIETSVQVDSALDMINVVPNPYYAFSDYETGSFNKEVKITNLPPNCTVTIYSLDGKFIRQFRRDAEPYTNIPGLTFTAVEQRNFAPDIRWDLTNSRQIPISSGVYLIHVDAPGLGERVIKWFGVNRQFDPTGL